MNELSFNLKLPILHQDLFELLTDFENYTKFVPSQLKYIKILEKDDVEILTEEKFYFQTLFKKEIVQHSIHHIKIPNKIQTEILDGPVQGTIINISLSEEGENTDIIIQTKLKLKLRYRIILPVIKRFYGMILKSTLYKMRKSIE